MRRGELQRDEQDHQLKRAHACMCAKKRTYPESARTRRGAETTSSSAPKGLLLGRPSEGGLRRRKSGLLLKRVRLGLIVPETTRCGRRRAESAASEAERCHLERRVDRARTSTSLARKSDQGRLSREFPWRRRGGAASSRAHAWPRGKEV